ncbi:hypothetical protein EDC01DRAFT_630722 [Geopyxis carbonaria]|nr:hypothetical protein EDC01DRAFT_630722 [Geopyxis carbonaria]
MDQNKAKARYNLRSTIQQSVDDKNDDDQLNASQLSQFVDNTSTDSTTLGVDITVNEHPPESDEVESLSAVRMNLTAALAESSNVEDKLARATSRLHGLEQHASVLNHQLSSCEQQRTRVTSELRSIGRDIAAFDNTVSDLRACRAGHLDSIRQLREYDTRLRDLTQSRLSQQL